MDIATVMNVHGHSDVTIDTLESILTFVTDKILILVDGAAWQQFENISLKAHKLKGFYHNQPKSPYRNVALALKTLAETWADVNWYLYCEYDVLFGSDRFKHNLRMAEEKDVWMLGNDGHVDNVAMPLVQAIIGEPLKSAYYLLGCCQFFHRNYIKKLNEIDFFEKFLTLTNDFSDGFFPFYSGYDISEHMYPTLCRHFGGNIGVFAHYDENGKWHGSYEYFPCRWRPDIREDEGFINASILHPVKEMDSPVRVYYREKRRNGK